MPNEWLQRISRCFSKVVSVKKKKTKNSHAVLLAAAPNKAGEVKAERIRADPRRWPHTRCSNPLWTLQPSRAPKSERSLDRPPTDIRALYVSLHKAHQADQGFHSSTDTLASSDNRGKNQLKRTVGRPCSVCTECLEAVPGPRKEHNGSVQVLRLGTDSRAEQGWRRTQPEFLHPYSVGQL